MTPNIELTHGQYVDVAWSGFQPSTKDDPKGISIRLCPASATGIGDCAKSSPTFREPGDTRVTISGPDGGGSIPFVIKAGDVIPLSGGDPFFCDADRACKLIVFQLDSDSVETSFSDSAAVDLAFAPSTVPCPVGGDKIAGAGGSSARGALVQWQSEVCKPAQGLDVSYVYTNSVQGTDAFVKDLPDSDFAVTGMPMSDSQNAALKERGVTPQYVPISAGSLVFVYNIWFDRNGDAVADQMKDLRLSPEALTGIFQGRISSWNDPLIQADNPDVKMPPKQVKAVARADNSAATWWLTSWLTTAAADAWKAGGDGFPSSATTTFPAGRGIILVTGTDNVAKYVRTFPGEQSTDNTDVPFAGFIGYVYYSEAIKLGLPVVAVKNAGGGYVRPTLEGVTAGFNAGAVESGGTFAPNFHSTDQAAYPLPVASYLVAASGDSKGVIAKTAETIGKFLMYATGPGQQAATTRGYVPLTAAMKSAADTNAAKIAAKPASSIAPSSAAASTAPVAPLDPQVLAAAATLGTDGSPPTQAGAEGASVASPAPVGAPTQPASAYSGSTSSTTAPADAAQAGPLAPAKKAIETVSRAVEGVIGVGSIGSVPIGLPVLALGAACALLLGRLLLSVSRRRVLGETTIGERSDATAVIVTDVGELVHSIRVER